MAAAAGSEDRKSSCRRLSCVYPGICDNLEHRPDHPLVRLYRKARELPGIRSAFDRVRACATTSRSKRRNTWKELVTHHVGGYLKIAPEAHRGRTAVKMMKPGMGLRPVLGDVRQRSKQAGLEQLHLILFIIAAPRHHRPGHARLALWLKAEMVSRRPGAGRSCRHRWRWRRRCGTADATR